MSSIADVLRAPRLDRALAEGADPASEPGLLARARHVTSWRVRRRIARALEQLESGPGIPVRRDQLREADEILAELATALRSRERVSARGVLLARRIVTDGCGPLYAPDHPPAALWWRVREALRAL
jgi:HEAT repeat protein